MWQLKFEDGNHTGELEHGYFSGKRSIRVDGNTILDTGVIIFFLLISYNNLASRLKSAL